MLTRSTQRSERERERVKLLICEFHKLQSVQNYTRKKKTDRGCRFCEWKCSGNERGQTLTGTTATVTKIITLYNQVEQKRMSEGTKRKQNVDTVESVFAVCSVLILTYTLYRQKYRDA